MTRRIAITILLTVWGAIVAAGLAAWFTARTILLADLDGSILQRARLVTASGSDAGLAGAFAGDRYVIKGALDQTLGRQSAPRITASVAQVLDASFVQLPEGRFRRLTLRFPDLGGGEATTVIYSVPAADTDRVLRHLALALEVCGAVAGAMAAMTAARLARIALRPLSQTAELIGGIDESHLDRRIDEHSLPVELRPMAGHLNEMIERLQHAFEQRRRFLANASHELRTPVAAMITTMEVALRRPRPAEELVDTMRICLDEAGHLRELVQGLLRQVRADGTSTPQTAQLFDAGQTVRQCADLAGPLGAERQIRVVRHVDGAIPMCAEPERLRSVVLNLVSNAIEYNHPGGTVEVSARSDNGDAEIVVSDDGPGIAAEHLPYLFQPFYRANPAQNRDGQHLGLGLFLVDSHVKAMGGQCRVESALGAGTTFRVRVPRGAAATGGAVE